MAQSKTIAFEMYEEIGIGLPNMYQCRQCKRLINCMHPPEGHVCHWCAGVPNDYEKVAVSTVKG